MALRGTKTQFGNYWRVNKLSSQVLIQGGELPKSYVMMVRNLKNYSDRTGWIWYAACGENWMEVSEQRVQHMYELSSDALQVKWLEQDAAIWMQGKTAQFKIPI